MSKRSPFSALEWAVIVLFPISPIILIFVLAALAIFPVFTAFVVAPIVGAVSILGIARWLNRRDSRIKPTAESPDVPHDP